MNFLKFIFTPNDPIMQMFMTSILVISILVTHILKKTINAQEKEKREIQIGVLLCVGTLILIVYVTLSCEKYVNSKFLKEKAYIVSGANGYLYRENTRNGDNFFIHTDKGTVSLTSDEFFSYKNKGVKEQY